MSRCCEGRVVVITGAGGGLGAAHARVFAAEGAKVVVNDINAEAAQGTVDEIKAGGAEAVVNTSDITNYDDSLNAVKQALDTFGGLHVVVNNAGICRDRMFASMTEADWDAVIAVHLKGHFCITSQAVHYWRGESKAGKNVNGRIINTTSGAGLQGSIGQSNYAAAKAGIAALTLNQAAELLIIAARERGSAGSEGISLFILPATSGGIERTWLPTMDRTRKQAEIKLINVRVPTALMAEEGQAGLQLEKIIDLASVAIAVSVYSLGYHLRRY